MPSVMVQTLPYGFTGIMLASVTSPVHSCVLLHLDKVVTPGIAPGIPSSSMISSKHDTRATVCCLIQTLTVHKLVCLWIHPGVGTCSTRGNKFVCHSLTYSTSVLSQCPHSSRRCLLRLAPPRIVGRESNLI